MPSDHVPSDSCHGGDGRHGTPSERGGHSGEMRATHALGTAGPVRVSQKERKECMQVLLLFQQLKDMPGDPGYDPDQEASKF